MRLIKIEASKDGAHNMLKINRNTTIPEGYAQIPDDMVIPSTFPFVNIEVAEETRYKEVERYPIEVDEETEDEEPIIERVPYTVMVVTSITAGVVPEPAPIPEPTGKELTVDDMANAILEGVNDI